MTMNVQPSEAERYALAWRESRRRFRQFLVYWIGGPFFFMATMMLVGALFEEGPPKRVEDLVFMGCGLAWAVGCFVLGFRHATFPCPRCGESFYMRAFGGNVLARRCLNCKLPKGALPSEAGPDTRR